MRKYGMYYKVNPWTGETSFYWRNQSKSNVYAAPRASGFPYSSTLSREAEKVSLQENLRKEKRGLDNLHLLWMHSDMFCLSFFELLFESMSGLSLGKFKCERFIKNTTEKWFYCSMHSVIKVNSVEFLVGHPNQIITSKINLSFSTTYRKI